MRSYSPQWLWRCRSRGYRQLCSLWFEYDPCLNRKPPNDLKSCLTTLIRIRSTSVPKRGWAMIRIRSRSPLVSSAVCWSRGYRQLCSLWFEYDLCLNRKPPNDLKSCLTTLIRIRSTSVPKGGWAMIQIWSKKTPQWARHFANHVGIDSYVLFGSNTTYVWTGSPQVIILLMARFEYDHKPDQPPSDHVMLQWK